MTLPDRALEDFGLRDPREIAVAVVGVARRPAELVGPLKKRS